MSLLPLQVASSGLRHIPGSVGCDDEMRLSEGKRRWHLHLADQIQYVVVSVQLVVIHIIPEHHRPAVVTVPYLSERETLHGSVLG